MPKPAKLQRYQTTYLIGPAIAYGCFILLLIVALIKQHTGVGNISFMFLSFWGVLAFLTSVVLDLFGFIHNRQARRFLLTINVALSAVIVILSISALFITQQPNPIRYSCQDYVRCVIN